MKIYTHFEAVPSRILGTLRLLRSSGTGGVPRESITRLLQPVPLRKDDAADSLSTKTLAALRELSSDGHALLEEREDGRGRACLILAAPLADLAADSFEFAMRSAVKRAALRSEVNGEANRFAELMAWLSWLPPGTMPDDHASFKSRLAASGLDLDAYALGNDQRWDNLVYWGRFVGLLWQAKRESCAGVVADPTDYLREVMPDLFVSDSTLPIHEFRIRLGAICPALDGGSSSTRVAGVMASKRAIGDDFETRLSPSLCLALRTLKQAGEVDFGCPDDQRKFMLMTGNDKISFVSRRSTTP